MNFLHTMLRISDIDESLRFYCDGLGLTALRRVDNEKGRFSLIFLASPNDVARAKIRGDLAPDDEGSGDRGTGDINALPNGLPMIELTYNWPNNYNPDDYRSDTNMGDQETSDSNPQSDIYSQGRNFGHLAYRVEDIYAVCARLVGLGYTINRPPRDGYMAFTRSPDHISIELLQQGAPLAPQEPWVSQDNIGQW